jgi:hypothetical protein
MLKKLRPRLTFANVMSVMAFFTALATGGAYAANEWNGTNIQDGTLTGADIQDLSLGLPDLGVNSVSTGKIKDQDVRTQDLRDLGVTSLKLAADSVSTGKLKDQDVRTQDLRDLGVTNSKIAWDSVSSGKVINNTLTGADINEGTLDIHVTRRMATSTDVSGSNSVSVSCESDEQVTGGGVSMGLGTASKVHWFDPGGFPNSNGWYAAWFSEEVTRIHIYVLCLGLGN